MRADAFFTYETLFGFLYTLARVSAVFAFLPLAVFRAAPQAARIVMAAMFTLALKPWWHVPQGVTADVSVGRIIGGMASEAAVGVAIGLTLAIVLEVFQMAAQIVTVQAGYGYASTVDPTSGADSTVLITVAQLMAGLLFFVSGADHLFVKALAESLRVMPPGTFVVQQSWGVAMMHFAGIIFSSGVRLAAPVIALLLLAEASLAILGRLQPQIQLTSLTMPVKLAATLLVIAATMAYWPGFFGDLMMQWSRFMEGMLRSVH